MQVNNVEASYTLSRTCTDIFAQGSPKTASEVLKEQGIDNQAVKVDISEEGLNAYKQMYEENSLNRDFKSLGLRLLPGEMAFTNEGWPDIEDFLGWGTSNKMMMGKISQDYYFDPYISIKEKAAMLLEAYAEAYDEIVKGYENGTREKYVIDMDTEELYRKATMEEDLEYLRKELESRAGGLEKYIHESDCFVRRAKAASAMDEFLFGSMSIGEALKAGTLYKSMKDEENIVNIQQSILNAASLFVSQYKETGSSNLNIRDFLTWSN